MRTLAALLILALPLSGHHSFKAEFDPAKEVTLKGVVTKVEWTNPHIWFYVDVKAADGKLVNWAVEAAGPNSLARRGWTRNSLRTGDRVTVTAYRARDGEPVASAARVVMSDGTMVLTQ
jgi:hypothetical protein